MSSDTGCDGFEACLGPGDWPVLHSDVLTDAINGEHEDFGLRGLVESLARRRDSSLPDPVQAVLRNLDRCRGQEELGDDPALVAVTVIAPFTPVRPSASEPAPNPLTTPIPYGRVPELRGIVPVRTCTSLASERW